ncbi:PepSY domain-containing protein [Antarctobacter sp.]|uniref:PepSY domain-containing protein n=1 Tax=Antarctobacter sp. TaxID=1872577 RepID=UPI002B2679D3|nr:PepSY domain-containing protein [Antarctobacter sp.]
MTRTLIAAALVGLIALPAAASDGAYGKIDKARKAEITKLLTEQGYDVRRIDTEDGLIEVYALKDGQRLELYLDAELNITRTKTDK